VEKKDRNAVLWIPATRGASKETTLKVKDSSCDVLKYFIHGGRSINI